MRCHVMCRRLMCQSVILVAAALLPACSTSEKADASPRVPVLSVADLIDAMSAGGSRNDRQIKRELADKLAAQEGSVTLTASLQRGVVDVLKTAPRVEVTPQRRSVHPDDELRLEIGDTGHSVLVTRAHLHKQWLRALGRTRDAEDEIALRSPATYHRYDTVSPQDLLNSLNCTTQAQSSTLSSWKEKSFNVLSHAIGGKDEVIAVVVADPDMYKKEQWVNDQRERNTGGVEIDYSRVGFSIVRYDHQANRQRWISGSGAIGYRDGSRSSAVFSDRITSLAWYPSCSNAEWTSGLCPPMVPGPARPYFYQPVGGAQWIYVADSGNCRVRLVNYYDGSVITRWGADCLNETAKSDLALYKDSNISARNVLGSDLSLAWVSWKFLLVVDRDANRIRKFVTSQHQGLSPLAGAYNTTACNNESHVDGDGLASTFCRPEAVTASADGSRVVVSEALEHYGSHDGARRLRVLDLHYTFLEGGDVGDVTCTVRTLRRMSLSLPGNALLWSRLGGMVLSPDGRVLIAGSADPSMLHFRWTEDHWRTGGGSFVVALALETGQLRLLVDANGKYLHDASVLSAVGTNGSSNEWYQPDSNIVDVVMARHAPAGESELLNAQGISTGITWTNPVTTIERLVFDAGELAQNCPNPGPATTSSTAPPLTTPSPSPSNAPNVSNASNATNATTTTTPAPTSTPVADYSGGGLVTCPQQCQGLRAEVLERERALQRSHSPSSFAGSVDELHSAHARNRRENGVERADMPAGAHAGSLGQRGLVGSLMSNGVVVVDDSGALRLLAASDLRALMLDAEAKSPNPSFA